MSKSSVDRRSLCPDTVVQVKLDLIRISSVAATVGFLGISCAFAQQPIDRAAPKLPAPTLDRTILPIPDRGRAGLTTYDAKNPETSFPPIVPLRPPTKAPNVLIVLLDDVGFGASSAFGGPVNMPTAEKMAAEGLRYTRFHTTAMCAPTRAALLTGRNHHSVGFGTITETATSAPGYNTTLPNTKATIQQTLRLNGYATAMFGKSHEVPIWEQSPAGPFDRWPTGTGFSYFYGFIGGETNQYFPALYENSVKVDPPRSPEQGYTLNEDLADRSIAWIRGQKALAPDQPFFVYYASGATHAPHHVPAEWREKYKGRFDQGWDKLREQTFARQKELGVIPRQAELTARHKEIPAWDEMPETLKPVLRRQMENYAGFLEQTDHEVGRVVQAISDMGMLDNTLIYYIIGDNGASGEGTLNGTFSEHVPANGLNDLETPQLLAERIDLIGTPRSHPHYAVGWAHALDTPYQWAKQTASHWGGTRNGMIVRWPDGFKAKGEVRNQFHHVIDVAPTILEAANLPQPTMVNGVLQAPIEGVSMSYTFDDAKAADRHVTQYFEQYGNRGIYHQGWTASTRHSIPWLLAGKQVALDDDVWELYDTNANWTQAQSGDLAKQNPQKLAELQRLFLLEGAKYNVFPLDDRRGERFNSDLAGRPTLIRGNRQVLYSGMEGLPQEAILNLKNTSHSITAEIVADDRANGVILGQGGTQNGWAFYFKDGKLKYGYNYATLKTTVVTTADQVSKGSHQVRLEFVYDGGGLGKGAGVRLYVDGKKSGEGRLDASIPFTFGSEDRSAVGRNAGSPVIPDDYKAGSAFTGQVNWVVVETGDVSSSKLITPQ
jgi:arylsulfatase